MPALHLNTRSPLLTSLVLSCIAGGLLVRMPSIDPIGRLCGTAQLSNALPLIQLRIRLTSEYNLVADWVLMTLAMMLPITGLASAALRRDTPYLNTTRAVVAFIAAYLSCWLLSGLVLMPLGLVASTLFSSPLALGSAVAIAIAWSFTSVARQAQFRCRHPGRPADGGGAPLAKVGILGLLLGRDCVLACWPWMIVPMFAMGFHHVAMAIVTIVLVVPRRRIEMRSASDRSQQVISGPFSPAMFGLDRNVLKAEQHAQ